MKNDDLERQIRELAGQRLLEALEDPEEGKKAAVIGQALAWLDGKGRKNEQQAEINEYAQRTRKALEGQKLPKLDDGDDAASHEV